MRWTNRIISGIAARRPSWPGWLNRIVDAAVDAVPEPIALRLNPAKYGFKPSEVPQPPDVPTSGTRLYIAPVNFAGQAYEWARAAERLEDVTAVNMSYPLEADYGFPTDNLVPTAVFRNSRAWQRTQFATVSRGFSHVMIEAERPIFGALFDYSPAAEVDALRRHGVKVAMLSHGTDLRQPSRHREIDEWSPFRDDDWDLVEVLEEKTRAHHDLLRTLGAPVFVSTPDLLLDWPDAVWLPLVLDAATWVTPTPPLTGGTLRVVHAPSNARIKGTALIEPIVRELEESGLLTYRQVTGVPSSDVPALYHAADVVLEQFRIGTYSRAAVEGMAAGRIVVAHVHEQVRAHVRDTTGLDVPVVEATPASLASVLTDIANRPEHYRAIAASGPDFAARVHDGAASAEALRPFLRS